jgi:nicotinamidase-related amidase
MSGSRQTSPAGGAFAGHLAPGRRPALIVIDFVGAYVTPGSPLYGEGCIAARAPAIELLGLARAAGIPCFHTNLSYQKGGRDGGLFFQKLPALACFEAGQHPELCVFAAGLEPRAGETVITKQYASAFFGTTLASSLTALGIDTLLIAGVSTSGCIRATAVDCVQHGFVPLVVREAVGDRAPGPHEANLFDLQAKYAEIVTLADVRSYLASLPKSQ